MRDDFPQTIKDLLAKRVGYHCSNPKCQALTSGPQENPNKSINIGVAAHIAAASPDGPRYNDNMTSEERKSPDNGIWLCQKCAKLIDSDVIRYNTQKLQQWKQMAEENTAEQLEEGPVIQTYQPQNSIDQVFIKIQSLMPDLISEMVEDMREYPLRREFVLLSKKWTFRASGNELIYYFEEHPELENKIRVLENNGLVSDITRTNAARYLISEGFADYLLSKGI